MIAEITIAAIRKSPRLLMELYRRFYQGKEADKNTTEAWLQEWQDTPACYQRYKENLLR